MGVETIWKTPPFQTERQQYRRGRQLERVVAHFSYKPFNYREFITVAYSMLTWKDHVIVAERSPAEKQQPQANTRQKKKNCCCCKKNIAVNCMTNRNLSTFTLMRKISCNVELSLFSRLPIPKLRSSCLWRSKGRKQNTVLTASNC